MAEKSTLRDQLEIAIETEGDFKYAESISIPDRQDVDRWRMAVPGDVVAQNLFTLYLLQCNGDGEMAARQTLRDCAARPAV